MIPVYTIAFKATHGMSELDSIAQASLYQASKDTPQYSNSYKTINLLELTKQDTNLSTWVVASEVKAYLLSQGEICNYLGKPASGYYIQNI